MPWLEIVLRSIVALILIVFPVNALFLKLFRPTIPERGALLMKAFTDTGYLLPFIQYSELVFGILLLFNVATPLVLVLLIAITVNIFLFHIFLAPPVFGPGPALFVLNVALIVLHYRDYLALIRGF